MTDKTEFLEGLYVQHIEGYSPPDGYWLTADVMRFVLGIWWGQRSQLEDTTIYGHTASWGFQSADQKHTPFVDAEQMAQHRGAQNVLWEGLADGKVEANFQGADGLFKSIPKDAWFVLPRKRRSDFLGLGYSWGFGSEAPELGENNRPFIFEREACIQWLRTIRSPHTLPNPLMRDASLLRGDTYISLCETVTWLANGVPKCAAEFQADSVVGHDYLLHEVKRMEGEFDGRGSDEFGDFIAEHLAQDVRIDEACREIENAVSSGKVDAYGSFSDANHEPLPKHVFAGGAEIIIRNDMIGAGEGTNTEDYRSVSENGAWKKVRLLTQQVRETWGLQKNQINPVEIETERKTSWTCEVGLPEVPPVPSPSEMGNNYRRAMIGLLDSHLRSIGSKLTATIRQRWLAEALGCPRPKAREYIKLWGPEWWSNVGRPKSESGNPAEN